MSSSRLGQPEVPAQAREVDARRVAEQQEDEGELAEPLGDDALELHVHETETGRPDGEAGRREDHGRRDAALCRAVWRPRRTR